MSGLLLSMHQILPPGNPPTPPGPGSTDLGTEYLNAKAAHDKKVTAFNEAAEMVSAARSDQQRVTVIAAGVGGVVFGALGSWGGEELYEYGKETFS